MRSRRARPGLHRPGERCGITIITTSSRPRRRQPTASGGVPNEIPALRFAPHRCAERAHRPDRVLARARPGAGRRWPARLLVPVGFFLLSLQGLSELIKRIAFLKGLIPDPLEKHEVPLELAIARDEAAK